MDQAQIKDFIVNNLPRNKHFTLATIDDQGVPWAVALKLCYDRQFDVFWQSEKTAAHSRHIADRPDVAICVAGTFGDVGDFGLYARAAAYEVTDEQELAEKLQLRFELKGLLVPSPSDFLGDSPRRLYCAKISQAWINDQNHVKRPVDLAVLRAIDS